MVIDRWNTRKRLSVYQTLENETEMRALRSLRWYPEFFDYGPRIMEAIALETRRLNRYYNRVIWTLRHRP